MSFAFIDPNTKIAVSHEADTVYVAGKLSKRQRGLVQQELLSLQIRQSSNGSGKEEDTVVDAKVSAHLHELALLKAAVVDWDGPSFRFDNGTKVPCNSHWVERIDPDLPIWKAVLERIDELNTPQTVAPAPMPVEAPAPEKANEGDHPNGQLADNTLPASETGGTEG